MISIVNILRAAWDADALAYIAQVEAADGQALEPEVKLAMNRLFLQLKRAAAPIAPSNWDALKAGTCLILAGPRTLEGALVPMHASMPTPTNYNFVSGDYHRALGLKGDGSTKEIDLNHSGSLLPQDDFSQCVLPTESGGGILISGGRANIGSSTIGDNGEVRSRYSVPRSISGRQYGRVWASSRFSASEYWATTGDGIEKREDVSQTSYGGSTNLFNHNPIPSSYSSSRLAAAGQGRALDLPSMDAAWTEYLTTLSDLFS